MSDLVLVSLIVTGGYSLWTWFKSVTLKEKIKRHTSQVWEGVHDDTFWTTANSVMLWMKPDGEVSIWKTNNGRYFVLSQPWIDDGSMLIFPSNERGVLKTLCQHYSPTEARAMWEILTDQKLKTA